MEEDKFAIDQYGNKVYPGDKICLKWLRDDGFYEIRKFVTYWGHRTLNVSRRSIPIQLMNKDDRWWKDDSNNNEKLKESFEKDFREVIDETVTNTVNYGRDMARNTVNQRNFIEKYKPYIN